MVSHLMNFLWLKFFYLKTQITLFMWLVSMFCMMVYFFPHLFPEFVAYAMSPDSLEALPSDNLPVEGSPESRPFLTPSQKDAAYIAGYTLYWAFVGFSVTLSLFTSVWFYTSAGKC